MTTETSRENLTAEQRRQLRELARTDIPALIRLAVSLVLLGIVAFVPGLLSTALLILAAGVLVLQVVPSSFALWRTLGIALDLRAGRVAVEEGTLTKVERSTSRYLHDAVLDGRKLRLIPAVARAVEIDRRYRVTCAPRSRIAFSAEPLRAKVKRRVVAR